MGDQRRVILVGCGQRKLTHAAPARELYTGALFVAQRRYAEASGCPWAILSAKYGLVLPDRVLEVLAGEDYAAALRLAPGWSSLLVTEPLRGLTLGFRRRWLAEMTAERQAAQEVSRG